jgi:hypothetical protein
MTMLNGNQIREIMLEGNNLVLVGFPQPVRINIEECLINFVDFVARKLGKTIELGESRCIVIIRSRHLEFLNNERTRVNFPDQFMGMISSDQKFLDVVEAIRANGYTTYDMD